MDCYDCDKIKAIHPGYVPTSASHDLGSAAPRCSRHWRYHCGKCGATDHFMRIAYGSLRKRTCNLIGTRTPPNAPILAGPVDRLDYQRVFAYALLDRWQLTLLDQLRKLWGFVKCRGPLARIGDDRWPLKVAN